MMNYLAIFCLALLAIGANVSGASQVGSQISPRAAVINSRITNGENAEPNSIPYIVAMQNRPATSTGAWTHHCAASIISSTWLVTAAHCRISLTAQYQISAGRHNLNLNEPHQQDCAVIRWIINEDYDVVAEVGPHDIAVIKIASPLIFNHAVQPISLPPKNFVHAGNVVLSGWGSISLTWWPVRPTVLQTVQIPIVNTALCYYKLDNLVEEDPPLDVTTLDNVCTGPIDDSRIASCGGDSGGPVAQLRGGVWELVGVVSWAIWPCGIATAPSVHVRTSVYIDWINEHIAANS